MNIYVDDGEAVKIYTVTPKIAEGVMILLEADEGLIWSKTLKQEPCEDSISRQAVMNCFKKWQPYMATRLFGFEKELSSLPPVTPQPNTGHWQKISADKYSEHAAYYFRCSECGKDIIGEHNYCANCGARMIEKEDDVQ